MTTAANGAICGRQGIHVQIQARDNSGVGDEALNCRGNVLGWVFWNCSVSSRLRGIVVLTLFLGFVGKCNGEVSVDPSVLRFIVEAHKKLEESTQCVAGQLTVIHKDGQTERQEVIRFAKALEKLRLEYWRSHGPPQQGPEWAKKEKPVSLQEIFISTGDRWCRVECDLSEDTATLYRSEIEDTHFRVKSRSSFLYWLTALVAYPETRVVDLLQRPIKRVEIKSWGGLGDALWIEGEPMVSEEGTATTWTVVLNPRLCYAAVLYEFEARNEERGHVVSTRCEIEPQVIRENDILPRRIVQRVVYPGRSPVEREYSFDFSSVGQVDRSLFDESSLRRIAATVVVVDVSPDGKRVTQEVIYNRARPKAQSLDQTVSNRRQMGGVVIAVVSIVAILLTGLFLALRRNQ